MRIFWPVTYLGALIGVLLASIPGLLLGALLGQVLDRRLRLDSWRSLRDRLTGKPPLEGNELLFALLGHLAKSTGRVLPAHIQVARLEMIRQRLDSRGEKVAIKAFNRGKLEADGLRAPLLRLVGQTEDCQQLLQALWRMARAGSGVGVRQQELILLWGGWMGLEPAFITAQDVRRQRAKPAITPLGAYQQALTLLGVKVHSEPDEIKRAYRRLLSQHHPDKLAGAGASDEEIRRATDHTRQLHEAYDLVRTRRGFR